MSTGVSIPAAAASPPSFQPIAQVFDRGLSIRHVYGEPVRQGDVTVIPVAKVAFGFGAGVGRGPRRRHRTTAVREDRASIGTGGGGGGRITPVGALVIGRRGARFVRFGQVPRLVAALSIGVGIGLALARRSR